MNIRGKVALVTGAGRNEGIGAAICRELAQQGADVFFTYWHPYDQALFPEKDGSRAGFAPALQDALQKEGVRAASIELDLSRPESPEKLFHAVIDTLGTPDILINNACYSTNQPLAGVSAELLDAHYAVNVRATALLCKAFIEAPAGTGAERYIISMTSGQSLGVMPGELPYTITKAAVDMLTMQLAPQCLERGIRIAAVEPGPVDTGWIRDALRQQLLEEAPSGTIAMPEDVARFIAGMLAGAIPFENGAVVHMPR